MVSSYVGRKGSPLQPAALIALRARCAYLIWQASHHESLSSVQARRSLAGGERLKNDLPSIYQSLSPIQSSQIDSCLDLIIFSMNVQTYTAIFKLARTMGPQNAHIVLDDYVGEIMALVKELRDEDYSLLDPVVSLCWQWSIEGILAAIEANQYSGEHGSDNGGYHDALVAIFAVAGQFTRGSDKLGQYETRFRQREKYALDGAGRNVDVTIPGLLDCIRATIILAKVYTTFKVQKSVAIVPDVEEYAIIQNVFGIDRLVSAYTRDKEVFPAHFVNVPSNLAPSPGTMQLGTETSSPDCVTPSPVSSSSTPIVSPHVGRKGSPLQPAALSALRARSAYLSWQASLRESLSSVQARRSLADAERLKNDLPSIYQSLWPIQSPQTDSCLDLTIFSMHIVRLVSAAGADRH
ncbi:hypothetical protein BU17DRAFT_84725 [Hysterangium stoloniferum]|nr:hypothetical protein BU17DRAFT_84725 [Hysterangium stoloniferum]